MYGNFAVWSRHDKQPVFKDGAESDIVARVSPAVRLKVLRREAAHYLVRLPDMRQGYVRVDDVASAPASAASDMLKREAPIHTGVRGDFVPAPFLYRFIARVIDSILFWIALVVLSIVIGIGGAGRTEEVQTSTNSTASFGDSAIWISSIAILGFAFLYEWVGTAVGGTIGKSMLKVSVIDEATGSAPGMWKSFVRYGTQFVFSLIATIGFFASGEAEQWVLALVFLALYFVPYLWAFVDEGRTISDRIAGTWVVQYR